MNCAIYYHCAMGVAYRMDCPNGELYDEQKHQCLPIAEVTDCHLVDEKLLEWEEQWANTYPEKNMYQGRGDLQNAFQFDCPEAYGHFRNPADCTAYVECIDGVPYPRKCMSGTVFDPKREKCTWGSLVPDCHMVGGNHPPTENVANTFRCPKAHGLFRDTEDCRIFYHCFAGRHFRHECQYGTVFSTDSNLCTWPSLVPECQEVTTPPLVTSYESTDSQSQTTSDNVPNSTQPQRDEKRVKSERKPFIPFYADEGMKTKFQVEKVPPSEVAFTTPESHEGHDFEGFEFDMADPNRRHVPEISSDGLNDFRLEAPLPDKASNPRVHAEPYSDFVCPAIIFDQYFRDPLDCTVFHRCVKGVRFTFNCPRGTFFDAVYDICDFMENVPDCDHEGRRLGSSREAMGEFAPAQ
nr:hypothetical protein BaRGS_021345 [Batillaria attramentaria]